MFRLDSPTDGEAFNKCNQGWDQRPAEQKVHDGTAGISKIEMMATNASEEEGEQQRGCRVFALLKVLVHQRKLLCVGHSVLHHSFIRSFVHSFIGNSSLFWCQNSKYYLYRLKSFRKQRTSSETSYVCRPFCQCTRGRSKRGGPHVLDGLPEWEAGYASGMESLRWGNSGSSSHLAACRHDALSLLEGCDVEVAMTHLGCCADRVPADACALCMQLGFRPLLACSVTGAVAIENPGRRPRRTIQCCGSVARDV
jgi:hypothetical protein